MNREKLKMDDSKARWSLRATTIPVETGNGVIEAPAVEVVCHGRTFQKFQGQKNRKYLDIDSGEIVELDTSISFYFESGDE